MIETTVKTETVLLADDDPTSLELMKEALMTHQGYAVETATNGIEALSRILVGDIPIVVSDWMMPGMSGVDLCRNIRRAGLPQYVFFILVTGREGLADVVEGLASGADEFIPKPVVPAELNARVRSIQRLKRLHDEVRLQNQRLQQIQKLKSDWINMLVHDIRSPMSAILGYSDLARSDSTTSPKLHKWLGTVRREATRVSGMLEQMLVMAKSEDGRLKLSPERSDVHALLNAALESIGAMANSKRVRFEAATHTAPLFADIDVSLMRRVFDNLFENALRFTPRDSVVSVKTSHHRSRILISVADSGPGVSPESRDRIFDPYVTAHGGPSGQSQHGFGLAYCRIVAEAHGGTITCHDNEPTGTRFDLRIPPSAEHPTEAGRTEAAKKGSGSLSSGT